MGLRPTHLGYAYQDLLTAVRLVDLAMGRAKSVLVDTKLFAGDRFDDITSEWSTGSRERLQIKHTDHDRALSADSFTKDVRGLRLDHLFSSIALDLESRPGTSHRLVVRDTEPSDADLAKILVQVGPDSDPGPTLHGLSSTRFRFDAAALRANAPWNAMLAGVNDDLLRRICAALVVETGLPACSLNIREPGPAEAALLRRVTEELGAGRPPNRDRAAEDVALALIETAKAARSRIGTVTAEDLLPRLSLAVDFGAVSEGHPVDRAIEVPRPEALVSLVAAVDEAAEHGGVVLITGTPGIGKSWLCEQLGDALRDTWIAVRHHCWLGPADIYRNERVLTEVVVGSLLQHLATVAPDAVAQIRPRYAATPETLAAAVAALRRLNPDQPVALIVDGIDHVSRVLGQTVGSAFRDATDPAACLVEDLAALEMPPGAVLILASQDGPHLKTVDRLATRVTVPPLTRPELSALADRLGVTSAVTSSTTDPAAADRTEAVINLVEERSRGNALYATYLCRQAVGPVPGLGPLTAPDTVNSPLDRLRAVPASAHDLDDYYAYLLKGLTAEQRSAVSMLAVCDFAVTANELEEIFPLPGALVGAALNSVAPIIAQQPGIGGLKIHHESFSRFIRRIDGDHRWVDQVRTQAADWLSKRGFFTDARAFRHLPELLAALGRDDELARLVGPDFLSLAIAGLQPPAAIAHTVTAVARSAADRNDWPTLVRCVELSRARATYEQEGIPGSLVTYADVLVALVGADRVAASLMYEGLPTMEARWGVQLCAAVDRGGCAAPWETYLPAWDEAQQDERVHYGSESDQALFLAELRGRIRLPGQDTDDPEASGVPRTLAQRVARFLDQDSVPALERALDVLLDCLGYSALLDSVEHVNTPDRRAALLLHLADARAGAVGELPSARTLAVAAWATGACETQRLLARGVAVPDLTEEAFGGDVATVLGAATQDVLADSATGLSGPVRRWLALLTLAQAADSQAPTRLLPQLSGDGFYRAWLRFTVAVLGLRHDVEVGTITAEDASTAARIALDQLAENADAFTGRPRACDLSDIHQLVQRILNDAVAQLRGNDVALGVASLQAISHSTTTSLMGMAGTGPLTMTDLLSLLAERVDDAGVSVVHHLMQRLRDAQAERRALYSENADFELEMARVSLACHDLEEAQHCWERAARYMGAYGSHKDATIEELLEPLPQLAETDLVQARIRLARAQPLVDLVAQCTDGRGTAGTPQAWWCLLARLDPQCAAQLGAETLLIEPGLPDARVHAAHHQLLTTQASTADPVILAALRIAAGSGGQSIDHDIALLSRLAQLPSDDPARSQQLLPIIANAITATYDDRPMVETSHAVSDGPTAALHNAAQRCGGEGAPTWHPKPARINTSRQWFSPEKRYPTFAYMHAQQRPELPDGSVGIVAAVRDYSGKAIDDPPGPRWSMDALANAVGWRLMDVVQNEGPDAAAQVMHRIADEMRSFGPHEVLADVAAGLGLRKDIDPGGYGPLVAMASLLAFTKIRGGGGWRSFAGNDRLELWRQAHTAEAIMATRGLADRVVNAVAARSYGDTIGVSQALVSAFSIQPPDSCQPPAGTALACWDAAFEVIAHRLPGDARLGHGAYCPVPAIVTQDEIDIALCRLALATVALPERGDKRRALIAATVLLASRPDHAQLALAHVLSFDLGAGPLTWLLSILKSRLPAGPLTAALAKELVVLSGSEMLSVRVEASSILVKAGHRPVAPPATAAHPTLVSAVTAFLRAEDTS